MFLILSKKVRILRLCELCWPFLFLLFPSFMYFSLFLFVLFLFPVFFSVTSFFCYGSCLDVLVSFFPFVPVFPPSLRRGFVFSVARSILVCDFVFLFFILSRYFKLLCGFILLRFLLCCFRRDLSRLQAPCVWYFFFFSCYAFGWGGPRWFVRRVWVDCSCVPSCHYLELPYPRGLSPSLYLSFYFCCYLWYFFFLVVDSQP